MQQLILPLNLPPAFEEADFIVSKSNEDASLWLRRWPNWPSRCLSLYGEKGCGKTHLSHLWQQKTKAQRLQGIDFNQEFLSSLLKLPPFFILEDPQVITDGESLFHLYNHILSSKGGLLFLSPTPPAHWAAQLPDLRSRLTTIPAIRIHPPDDALLSKVIQKLFADLQVKVDDSVVAFLLVHMERSFETAHLWVTLLNTRALIQNRTITIPLVRQILLEQESAETDL